MNLLQVTMWPVRRFATTPSGHTLTHSVRLASVVGQPHALMDDPVIGTRYWTDEIGMGLDRHRAMQR